MPFFGETIHESALCPKCGAYVGKFECTACEPKPDEVEKPEPPKEQP